MFAAREPTREAYTTANNIVWPTTDNISFTIKSNKKTQKTSKNAGFMPIIPKIRHFHPQKMQIKAYKAFSAHQRRIIQEYLNTNENQQSREV